MIYRCACNFQTHYRNSKYTFQIPSRYLENTLQTTTRHLPDNSDTFPLLSRHILDSHQTLIKWQTCEALPIPEECCSCLTSCCCKKMKTKTNPNLTYWSWVESASWKWSLATNKKHVSFSNHKVSKFIQDHT